MEKINITKVFTFAKDGIPETWSLEGLDDKTETQSLAVVKAGYPGLKGSSLRVAWQDEAGDWMGWEDHNIIRDVCEEKLYCGNRNTYGSGAGTPPGTMIYEDNFAVCSAPDGKALIFIGYSTNIELNILNVDTMLIEDIFEIVDGNSYQGIQRGSPERTTYAEPIDAIVAEDGSIMCFSLSKDASAAIGYENVGDNYSIIVSRAEGDAYSTAAGWKTVSVISVDRAVANIESDFEAVTLKAATNRKGEVVLFVMLTEDAGSGPTPIIIYQYASADGGLTWTKIFSELSEVSTTPSEVGDINDNKLFITSIDVSYYDGTYYVITSKNIYEDENVDPAIYTWSLTISEINLFRIATPFISIQNVTAEKINTTNDFFSAKKVATYIGADGRIYLNCLFSTVNNEGPVFGTTRYGDVISWTSADGGVTFEEYTQTVAGAFGATNYDITDVKGFAISIFASSNVNASEDETYAMVIKSGGWTTYTHPRVFNTYPHQLISYGSLPYVSSITAKPGLFWVPFCLPDAFLQFEDVSSGTVSTTITSGDAFLVATAGISAYYKYETDFQNCTWDTGFILEGKVSHISGGAFEQAVNIPDGINIYTIGIRLTSTSLSIYDYRAGSAVSVSPITIASGNIIHYKLAFRKGSAALYYYDADKKLRLQEVYSGSWTSSLLIPDAKVYFGRSTSAGVFTEHNIYSIGFISTAGGGDQVGWNDDISTAIGLRYPAALYGAMLPIYGKGTLNLPSGLRISGAGGAGRMGEFFSISPASDSSAENVLIPSPQMSSKVDNAAGDASYVFNLMSSDKDKTSPIGPTFAVAIFNTSFRLFEIAAKDSDMGSYEDIGFLDTAEGLTGLAYTIVGDTIHPNSPSGTSRHFEIDELVGASIDFGSGKVRKIISNSEGRWVSTGKTCKIRVEGDVTTVSQNGTMAICLKEGAIILSSIGVGKAYKYLRVRIPAQATYNGTTGQVGTIHFGAFIPFSTKYSASRSITTSPKVDVTENRWGLKAIKKLGELSRQIEFSWAEGFNDAQIKGDAVGDWIALPPTEVAIGSRGNSTIMEGILRAVNSGEYPLVYIPKLLPEAYSEEVNEAMPQYTITGRNNLILANITDAVTKDVTGIGEEETAENSRIAGIRLVEVI